MTQNLLQGAFDAANTMQGFRMNTNKEQQLMQQQQREAQDREAQAQQSQQLNALKQQYADSGDPAVMRQIIMADPEFASSMQKQFGVIDENSRTQAMNQAGALKQMLEQSPEQAMAYWQENLSQNPAFTGLADNFQAGDFEGALNEIGWGVTALGGQEAYDSLFGVPESGNVPANVQEWNFYNTLTDDDKKKYLAMKRSQQTFKAGDVTMGIDQVGGGANVITEVGAEPTTQSEAQEALTEQSAVKKATEDAAKQAIALSEESFGRLSTVRTATANLDEAMRLVDEGANTGVIMSKLPSVQKASIELDNLQGQLGLDVIGNTTFGALSGPELKFALDTALPRNLDGPALKEWLTRKKVAQEKLTAYLEDAAIFLGTPGNTVAEFLEDRKGGSDLTNLSDDDLLNF